MLTRLSRDSQENGRGRILISFVLVVAAPLIAMGNVLQEPGSGLQKNESHSLDKLQSRPYHGPSALALGLARALFFGEHFRRWEISL